MRNAYTPSRAELEALLIEKCRLPAIRPWQLDHALDLTTGNDLFLVIAPGMGKSLVMAAPFLAAKNEDEDAIGIVIVPTKLLTEQQAHSFKSYGINAVAINEDTLRVASYEKRSLIGEVRAAGGVRICVITPWMALNDRLQGLITQDETRELIRWCFVDEAHLVNPEDDNIWTAPYHSMTTIRARLPPATVFAAFTGTATIHETGQISRALGFTPGSFQMARYSTDRPHVKIITRFLEHAYTTAFLDLSFVIPPSMTSADDIVPTLVFCETIAAGDEVIQFLDSLIPHHIPNRDRLVMPYNSGMTSDYRKLFSQRALSGDLRVGVVTDTCTYGLDIRMRRVVILWTGSAIHYSKIVQQAGRVARDNLPGTAIFLAPPWLRQRAAGPLTRQHEHHDKRRDQLPAILINFFNADASFCPRQVDRRHNGEDHSTSSLPSPCCNHHHPEPERTDHAQAIAHWKRALALAVAASSRPEPAAPHSDRTWKPLAKDHKESAANVLRHWRDSQWAEVCPADSDLPANFFLSDTAITRLCDKLHVCTTDARMQQVLGRLWSHAGTHGDALFSLVTRMLRGYSEIAEEQAWDEDSDIEMLDSAPPTAAVAPRRVVLKISTPPLVIKRERTDSDALPPSQDLHLQKHKARHVHTSSSQAKENRAG